MGCSDGTRFLISFLPFPPLPFSHSLGLFPSVRFSSPRHWCFLIRENQNRSAGPREPLIRNNKGVAGEEKAGPGHYKEKVAKRMFDLPPSSGSSGKYSDDDSEEVAFGQVSWRRFNGLREIDKGGSFPGSVKGRPVIKGRV